MDYLESMTDGELETYFQLVSEERIKRYKQRKQKAMDNFQKAYNELRDLGLMPVYNDPYEGDSLYLSEWDCFSFD